MAWTWQYLTADGVETTGSDPSAPAPPSPEFTAQADAETWIGTEWSLLLAAGVDAVTLLDEDHVVYGPMSLHPQD